MMCTLCYSRPSQNKDIWKWSLRRHNFCSWRHQILPGDSNYIVDVFMWPKFNSSSSMREVITTSILKELDQKNQFTGVVVLVQVQSFGTGSWCKLKILHKREKGSKLKVREILEIIPTFVEVAGDKLVRARGPFSVLPPSWIGLRKWPSEAFNVLMFLDVPNFLAFEALCYYMVCPYK